MLTSSALAPLRTCSSATSTAASRSSGLDERAESRRAGHVRPLADHHEAGVRPDLERLETAPAWPRLAYRDRPRRDALDARGDLADVLRRRPAAAADDVDEPVLREGPQEAAGVTGLLVVLAHRVREAGVRVAGDVRVGGAREVLEERAHLARAERAVDTDDQRPRVLDRDPERLRGLAGEVAAAPVDRREREPERHLRGDVGRRHDRRLRVQRVEDRLDEEEVDTALRERRDLLRVRSRAPASKVTGAEGGIVDLRRDRERHVERSDRRRRRSSAAPACAPSRRRPRSARAAHPRGSSRRRAPRGRSRPARSTSP